VKSPSTPVRSSSTTTRSPTIRGAPRGDADADIDGRPPFPWRPVVVVLGTEDDLDLADHARGLVNGMIRHDVEARLAVAAVPDGLHLSGPCRPTLATLRALQPDVIVTLDPGARAVAEPAAAENRTTVLVELLPDAHGDIEVGPLTIGRTDGRLGPGPAGSCTRRPRRPGPACGPSPPARRPGRGARSPRHGRASRAPARSGAPRIRRRRTPRGRHHR
jgi:hypothetical protein